MSDGPYSRLEEPDRVNRRHRIHLLGWMNVVLCLLLVLIGIILMGTLIPRAWYHRRFHPYPGNPCTNPFTNCPLILISMNGFRHDYLELVRSRYGPKALPNFHRFQSQGVRGMRSIGTYPTLTMPSHQTLVTGLNPESHGVVGDNLQDTEWPGTVFRMRNQTSLNKSPWLESWPEPIWFTLQRTGRLAGSLLWPLTDAPVRSDLPFVQVSEFTMLNEPESRYMYDKRVTDLLHWLDNPYFQLDLILAYFGEPDRSGHTYGPASEEVARQVVELDGVLGQLLSGLEAKELGDRVDIILTSGHGMTEVRQQINLDSYVDSSLYAYTELSTVGFLYPEPGKLDEVFRKLQGASIHMKVYKSEDMPAELNFSQNSSRMPALVVIPDAGWCLVKENKSHCDVGDHGYPTNVTDMDAFFLARGPSFLNNATTPLINALDIYPLMAGMLGINPRPNNGSLERIAHEVLKPDVAERILTTPVWFPRWWAWFMWNLSMIWIIIGFAFWVVLFSLLLTSVYVQRQDIRILVVPDTKWLDEKV